MTKIKPVGYTTKLSEVELFTELLDDKKADNILKKFNESVPGLSKPPLSKKKDHILKIFRKQTIKMRRFQGKQDPFIFATQDLKIEGLEGLSEEDLFSTLAGSDNLPEYQKLITAYYYKPDALRKRLEELTQRTSEGKPLFEDQSPIRGDEEAREYFRQTVVFSGGEGVNSLFETIEILHTKAERDEIRQVMKLVRPMSLGEFQKQLSVLRKTYIEELCFFAYGYSHKEEDDHIRLVIAANVLMRLYKLMMNNKNDQISEMLQEKKEVEVIISEFNKVKERAGHLQKNEQEMREMKKEKDKIEEQIILIQKQLTSEQQAKQQLEQSYQDQLKAKDKKVSYLEEQIRKMTKQHEEEKQRLSASQDQLMRIAESIDEQMDYDFAVIYNIDTVLFDTLFKEINSSSVSCWQNNKQNLFRRGIERIYLHRDGLPTKKINEIRTYAEKQCVEIETFMVKSEKELLEKIVQFKIKSRERKYDGS